MMKKLLWVFAVCVLTLASVSAEDGGNPTVQAPAMEWHKGYGTDGGDHAHFVMQTSDGGYIMTGESSSRNEQRILVVKTDSNGDKQWQRALGGDGEDLGNYICETADGDFVVAGAIDKNRALVKLSAAGNVIWEKTYPGSGRDAIEGIDLTGDGGIICTGYLNGEEGTSFIIHDGQAFLMKTDADGNVEWQKDLSPAASQGFKLREVDDGYAISGVSPKGDGNFCLIKTDKSGDIQWHREYGGDKQEDLYDFDVASDGGYVLAGHKIIYGKVSENTDVFDFWLVKVDSQGNLEWDKTFGQPRGYDPRYTRDECYGVRQTPDGGYIMCGGNGDETQSFSETGSPYGPSDIWQVYLVKTDARGNLLWESCYGSTEAHDAGEYLGLTRDGGYIIAVDADDAGADTYRSNNFGFMKIAPDTSSAKAPPPAMEWHYGLGTDTEEKCQHVMQTSDGGYLVVGATDEAAGRASDMLIVKADADGDEQWQKIIGTPNQHDWANISAEVADGYIVAGALSDSGDQERGIVKLDFDGDIVSGWPKTYHADGVDAIRGIDITGDGSIVATGYVGGAEHGYLFICSSGKGSIMKTDADGSLQWDKILPSTMHGMRVQEVAGGFAIGGNQWLDSEGRNHQDVVLVLTDSDGDETYHSYYGGDGDDQVFDFAVTTDGGYVFGGHSRSPSYGTVNWDFYLLKVGSDKKEQWHRTFGQPRGYDAKYIHDEAYGVQQTPDGGFIIGGGSGDEFSYSESGHPTGPSDEWKAYLVKTDADGNVQWEGLYPPTSEGNNAAEHVNLTGDGGYIVCTDSDTAPGPPPNNFGLMKIAPDTSAAETPAPAMQWHKGHGTDGGDHVHYGLQTSDGGYIMTGQASEGRRGSDMLVVKTDATGDLEWQKLIGESGQADYGTSVTEAADGFIAAGALSSGGTQERALLKFDAKGDIVWQKTYPAAGNGSIRGIDITADGGIVATGYVGSGQRGYQFISDDGEGSILKTDADGNLQWERTLPAAPHGMRVEEVAGGYAIGANIWVEEDGKNNQQVCLILTDRQGNQEFSRTYGGDGNDQVFDFAVTTDGGYIFAGHTRSYGVANWDFLLLKVGSDRKEQWHKAFGQPRGYDARYIHDESYGVKQTPDGGYVVTGGTGDEYRYSASGHPFGPSDLWLAYVVRTDGDGNLLWEGLYGDLEGNNAGEYINLTSDGGYVVFTDSDTAGSMGSNNFGLMKIAPDAAK